MSTSPHNLQVDPIIRCTHTSRLHKEKGHLPSFQDLKDLIENTLIDDRNLHLAPIRIPLVRELGQESEDSGNNEQPTTTDDTPDAGRWPSQLPLQKGPTIVLPDLTPVRISRVRELGQESEDSGSNEQPTTTDDIPDAGCWPSQLPLQKGPTIVFPDSDEEEETRENQEEEEEEEESGKDGDDDDEVEQCLPSPRESQSTTQTNLLTVSDSRPILRLSPKALAEGGSELEAQQYTLLHQYRPTSSSSTDEPITAPPAYVYQTPTAPQPSSGPVPFSFNVLRAQQGDLVNVRTPSVKAQGILRPTAIIEDEDESHKRYKCNWPNCGKKYDRPSSLEVHKYSHTRTQPFPCPESECTRAFSVKSNMLRHFRSHPKRAGMSAAEVSAASAKKAAMIAAATAEEEVDHVNFRKTAKTKGKEKEKEKEKNKEANKEKGKDKPKSSTSISTRNPRPPILTITPAPPRWSSTLNTYPITRVRPQLNTELTALPSSDPALLVGASKDSPVVSLPMPVSPASLSPSPSPLLSPHSPQSTYSSAPTSASAMSVGLLSPSFVSASASGSVAFSPPSSELLSPHSMYSPNSPYSTQSPHSPTASTTSEKEGEPQKGKELEKQPSGSPLRTSDHGQERSPFVPNTVSGTTIDGATSSTMPTCLPPSHRLSFVSTIRSPSPFSPQFRSRTLYPVSDARSSLDQNFWPALPPVRTDFHQRLVDGAQPLAKSSTTTKPTSPPRLTFHRMSSPPPITETGSSSRSIRHTEKRKRDSDNDARTQHGSVQDGSTPVPHGRVVKDLHSDVNVTKEVATKDSLPSSDRPSNDLHKTRDDILEPESNAVARSSDRGYWPVPKAAKKDFHSTLVDTLRPESSTTTELSSALCSAPPHATSPKETSPAQASETGSLSPRHVDKRRKVTQSNPCHESLVEDPVTISSAEKKRSISLGSIPSVPHIPCHRDILVGKNIGSDAPKETSDALRSLTEVLLPTSLINSRKSSLDSRSDRRARSDPDSDEEEPYQEKGFWPAKPPPQTRVFHNTSFSYEDTEEEQPQQGKGYWPTKLPPQEKVFHRLLNDDPEEEEDYGGKKSRDEVDIQLETTEGKKKAPFVSNRRNGFRSLKPGFAQEIGRTRGTNDII